MINTFSEQGREFIIVENPGGKPTEQEFKIANELIVERWERLRQWMEEEDQARQIYLRLSNAADLYETSKGGLLRDAELQTTWKWKEAYAPTASWASHYNSLFEKSMLFLEYSKTQAEQDFLFKEKMQKQR
ncbi:MAG: hypothetical protein EOO01_05460 [Chitinophagaceae bacterium]|nr:MAG: hypothetical protein EOO01_05460 [Chitinophagaceae bacterium]